MAKQIVIDHVFKVFGDDPQEALALVRQGLSKQEVLARTGQSIGVFDAHLSIEAGEIFVVMGLSGSGKSTLVRLLNLLIEPSARRRQPRRWSRWAWPGGATATRTNSPAGCNSAWGWPGRWRRTLPSC